jgi:hypothetical protein
MGQKKEKVGTKKNRAEAEVRGPLRRKGALATLRLPIKGATGMDNPFLQGNSPTKVWFYI